MVKPASRSVPITVSLAARPTGGDYARFVIGAAIKAGKPLKVKPDAIKPIATADYPTPAKRPANSRLDTRKFRETFGLELPHWQAGFGHILQQVLGA